MTTMSNSSLTQKKFDCLEFKQQVQAQIYQAVNAMNSQEIIEYFRQCSYSGALSQWWKTVDH